MVGIWEGASLHTVQVAFQPPSLTRHPGSPRGAVRVPTFVPGILSGLRIELSQQLSAPLAIDPPQRVLASWVVLYVDRPPPEVITVDDGRSRTESARVVKSPAVEPAVWREIRFNPSGKAPLSFTERVFLVKIGGFAGPAPQRSVPSARDGGPGGVGERSTSMCMGP